MNVRKNLREIRNEFSDKGWGKGGRLLWRKANQLKLKLTIEQLQWPDNCGQMQALYEGERNWQYYQYLQKKFAQILDDAQVQPLTDTCPPKIIWWCWLQGIGQAPELCQACLLSLRRNFPDYEIRTVSLENMKDYVGIPDYIVEKYRQGAMGAAHFSDILRTFLLAEHGGIWIDSTVYASHRPDEAVLRAPLFFYSTYMKQDLSMAGSSWLISSTNSHPVLLLVRELLLAYWKQYQWNVHYFIFHFFFHMALEKYKDIWEAVPTYSNIPPHIMQKELFAPYNEVRFRQISNMSAFHKLTHHKEAYPDGDLANTNYGHIVAEYKERAAVAK